MTEKQLIDGIRFVDKFQTEFDTLFCQLMVFLDKPLPYITHVDIDGEDVVVTSREHFASEDYVERFPIWALVNGSEGHERYKEMERKRLEEVLKPFEGSVMPEEDAKEIERLKEKYPNLFK